MQKGNPEPALQTGRKQYPPRFCLPVIALFINLFLVAPAQTREFRAERVAFHHGTTSAAIQGAITGYETLDYLLQAQAGQTMIVNMTTDNGENYFNLMAPGETEVAFFNGSLQDNSYVGMLRQSGEHTIRVYQMRRAALRNETANFTLNIEIASANYADGLMGGPDFWQISTANPSSKVNLREAASTSARIVESLHAGTVLHNKGCKIAGGRRWCSVEWPDNASMRGWIMGDFLRESGYVEPRVQTDALVPGTEFHATGETPCSRNAMQPMASCQFGVVRNGKGGGSVKIFWPDGGSRSISFEEGAPVSYDGSDADGATHMTFDKEVDVFIIRISGERFEILDAVIFGG